MYKNNFSHLDKNGNISMVDVSKKNITLRIAKAEGTVYLLPTTLKQLKKGETPKGNVLTTAKIAGITAAKKTFEMIPLCHQIQLNKVEINFKIESNKIIITSKTIATDKTGVEMEALTAVSYAALTIYDMLKAIDKNITISNISLLEKSGGKTKVLSGEVISVNISKKKGILKTAIKEANFIKNYGIENDAHAKKNSIRQVSLLSLSSFKKISKVIKSLKYGAFGENVNVDGVDVYKLPIGTKIYFLNGMAWEVTKIGKECHDKCAIYQKVGDCVMPREGIFIKVLKGGNLKAGDKFKVVIEE